MASVNGRVVTLPSPVVRAGPALARAGRVPAARARARSTTSASSCAAPSRLLLVGDVRVPRVDGAHRHAGPADARHDRDHAGGAGDASRPTPAACFVRIEADALDLALPAGGGGLIDQIRAGDQPTTVAVVLNAARRRAARRRQRSPTTSRA